MFFLVAFLVVGITGIFSRLLNEKREKRLFKIAEVFCLIYRDKNVVIPFYQYFKLKYLLKFIKTINIMYFQTNNTILNLNVSK